MSAPQGTTQAQTQAARPQKVRVPTKLSAIKKVELQLTDDSNQVGEPVVIAITSGERTEVLVVHHPIGAHKLQPEDWVLTPISEIEPLLAAADDPSRQKKAEAKQKLRIDHLLAKRKLLKDEKTGELRYPPDKAGGISLATANAEAKTRWTAAQAEARKKYLEDCEARGAKPKKDWRFGQAVNHFLSEAVKAYEAELGIELKADAEYLDKLKRLDPVPYETMAGPYGDRPQLGMFGGKNCPPRGLLIDLIKKHLINSMSGGYRIPAVPPKVLAGAIEGAGQDPTKLSEVLLKNLVPATSHGDVAAAAAAQAKA